MKVQDYLPQDLKTVVRLFVALVLLKVVINAVSSKIPSSVANYMPNLG